MAKTNGLVCDRFESGFEIRSIIIIIIGSSESVSPRPPSMLSPVNRSDDSAHDGGHPPSTKRTFDGLPAMSLLNLGSLSPANCEDLMWFVSPRASSQRLEASTDFEGPIDDFMYFVTSLGGLSAPSF